jgi:hypothetical protein
MPAAYPPEVADFIAQHLPTKGRAWVAKRLGKHPAAIHAWASRRGIRVGDLDGWTRVTDLARAVGVNPSNVWTRAKRDGVLRRVGRGPRGQALAAIVPNKWADAQAGTWLAQQQNEDERHAFLTVDQARVILRVGRTTVLRGLNGEGALAPHLANAHAIRGKRGTWLLNPHDVERVRRALDSDRQKARAMVSTKSLAVEHGVSQSYAAEVGRELGCELLFVRGRLCAFVSREVAEVMRERFGTGVTPGKTRGRPRKLPPA